MKEVLKRIVASIVVGVLMVGMLTSTGLAEQDNISNPSTQDVQTEDIVPPAPSEVQDENTAPPAPSEATEENLAPPAPSEATEENLTPPAPSEATEENLAPPAPSEATEENLAPPAPSEVTEENTAPPAPTEVLPGDTSALDLQSNLGFSQTLSSDFVTLGSTHSVTFNAGSHGSLTGTTSYTGLHHGDPFPTAPTINPNTGWSENGWSPSLPSTITGSGTYTAQYTAITYNISYNLDGGSVSSPDNPATYSAASGAITLKNPTKAGYTFTGWTGTGLSGNTMSVTIPAGSTGDRSYTAHWTLRTYSIIYDLNSGAVSPDNPTSYTILSDPITLNNPTRSGHIFLGWTGTGLSGNTMSVTIPTGSSGDRSYDANWADAITVSFNSNGGSSVPDQTLASGGKATKPSPDPTKSGYTFVNWYSNSGLTTVFDFNTNIYGNTTLYAKWTPIPTYIVTFSAGAHGSLSGTTSYSGLHIGDPFPAAPTINPNTGWSANGWSPSLPGTVTGTVTYTAQYTAITYNISYNLDGGTVSSPDNPVTYSAASAAITLNNPTKTGYTFAGWTGTGLSGNTMSVTIPAGSTGDRSYTAHWTLSTYSIGYNLNGGTATPANPTTYTILSAPITLNNPTQSNYVFVGWTGTDLSGNTMSVTIPTGSTGNRSYVANWLNTYLVTYYGNGNTGGTAPVDLNSPYISGVTVTVLDNTGGLTLTGHTFAGWNTRSDGHGTSYAPGAPLIMGSSNMNLYAQWADIQTFTVHNQGEPSNNHGTINVTYNGVTIGIRSHQDAVFTYVVGLNTVSASFVADSGWVFDRDTNVGGPPAYNNPATRTISPCDTTNIHPQWDEATYTVTFAAGAHGTLLGTTSYTGLHSGDSFPTAPTVNPATGWNFSGWSPSLPSTVTGSQTYTAQYTQINYTVTFNVGAHGTTLDTTSFTGLHSGDSFPTAPAITPDAGWTFDGWPVLPATVTSDASYTATYTQINYTVTFNVGAHGTTLDTTSFTGLHSGDSFPTAPAITPDAGWTFDGWPVLPATVTGDASYTATYTQINYTVTFNVGAHGTTLDTTSFTGLHSGDSFPTAPAITPDAGWTFDGWPVLPATVTGDASYTAAYTQIDYTVTYDGNGNDSGTVPTDGNTYNVGDTVTVLANTGGLGLTGYTFDGWNTQADGLGADCNATGTDTFGMPAVNVTLYAQWSINSYTVTYDGNGNTGGTAPTDVNSPHDYNEWVTVLGNTGGLVKTGYTFNGWNTEADDSGTISAPSTMFTMPAANVTLYARWLANSYTVTYDINTGDSGTTAISTHIFGIAKNLTTNGYTKTGYTFAGWNSAADGSGTAYTDGQSVTNLTSVNGATVTLYAQWTAIDYTITFNIGAHGSTLDMFSFTGLHFGDPFPTIPGITPNDGWTFDGWLQNLFAIGNANAGNSLSILSTIFPSTVTGSAVYTAQYAQIDYTVTFLPGANGSLSGTTIFTPLHYGDAIPAAPAVTSNPGYAFTGWSPFLPATVTGNATFTAQYSILTYSVRFFRANGVTQIGTTQTINWGGAAALETAPVIVGRTFAGWALTGDNPAVLTSLSVVKENIDAVATYTLNTYLVTFLDFNGNFLGSDSVPYGGSAIPPVDPIREGYTFTGWSPSYDNITGALTVTAEYTINTYTVTFVDFNGTVLKVQVVDWNTGATAPPDPTRSGFTFTGWDKTFDPVTSNITVTAQYSENPAAAVTTPPPTTIPSEPVPATGGNGASWLWWLLLIPAALLLWLLFAMWFAVIPIAETVTDNGNGTFTVQWGYDNRKPRKYTVDSAKSVISVIMGKLISNSANPPVEFEKGRVENVFTSIVDKDTAIEWRIKGRTAKVDITKLDK